MLKWRLKAYERLKQIKEPKWQKPKYPKKLIVKSYIITLHPKVSQSKPKT